MVIDESKQAIEFKKNEATMNSIVNINQALKPN